MLYLIFHAPSPSLTCTREHFLSGLNSVARLAPNGPSTLDARSIDARTSVRPVGADVDVPGWHLVLKDDSLRSYASLCRNAVPQERRSDVISGRRREVI